MYTWGLIGYISGIAAPHGWFDKKPVLLIWGFLSAMLYGLLLNGWYVIGFVHPITWQTVLAAYAAGFPLDLIHGMATTLFLAALYLPWKRKLDESNESTACNVTGSRAGSGGQLCSIACYLYQRSIKSE